MEVVEALDKMAAGFSMIGPDFRITYANQSLADMLGCSPEDLIGRHLLEGMDEPRSAEVLRAQLEARKLGKGEPYQLRDIPGRGRRVSLSVKPTALHGFSFWPYQHEPCLMGWKKGHKPAHDGDNSHRTTTVWNVDWGGKARVIGNEHPTQKPVELFAIPIRKHTRPGDICLESFAGSGSQLIAAEQLDRVCYAVEIEPAFCDVVIERWKDLTGEKAKRG